MHYEEQGEVRFLRSTVGIAVKMNAGANHDCAIDLCFLNEDSRIESDILRKNEKALMRQKINVFYELKRNVLILKSGMVQNVECVVIWI